MSKERIEQLAKLREHNTSIYKGDKAGTLKKTEIRKSYEDTINSFAKEVVETRQGKLEDRDGRKIPAYDISLPEALSDYYGIIAPEKDTNGIQLSATQKQRYIIKQFLKQNEVFMGSDTLYSAAQRFGNANLTKDYLETSLISHSQFDALNNSTQIASDHRFIIPELIMAAIRLDYEAGSMHNNWVANTVNISQRKVTIPMIRRGNATPRKIGEAESIPFGTVRFGKKEASVFKVGMGFQITDELVSDSTLDMMFEFLGEVGTEMAICSDIEASRILLNGEQADLSESAPTIGVESVGSYSFKDLKRAISRMVRLKRDVQRLISSENDGIDLSLLDEFKGFAGDKTLMNLQQMLGVPATLINDIFLMPDDQIMLLAPASAMVKLQYQNMKTERRRNPQTQVDELFISEHIGFAIKRRDGRVIINKSMTYGAPDNAQFPSYMDVDARINNSYKSIGE